MSTTQLDQIPVADLPGRYRVDRSRIYDRIKQLNAMGYVIQPERGMGGKSYLNAESLTLMDALDNHIKDGGAIATFGITEAVSRIETRQVHLSRTTQDDEDAPVEHDRMAALVELIAERVSGILTPRTQVDLLWVQETLERACTHGWHLSSEQLLPLLGLKNPPSSPYMRFGFWFERIGRDWRVIKVEPLSRS